MYCNDVGSAEENAQLYQPSPPSPPPRGGSLSLTHGHVSAASNDSFSWAQEASK